MNQVITVDFHGDQIVGVDTDAGAFVYLKPIVERLGLDWSAQLKRVKRDPTLSEGMAMMAIPQAIGGGGDAVFLRLDLLHGWLFTVDSARVKEDLRPKVIVYQRECYGALSRAFGRAETKTAEIVQTPADTMEPDLARRLVTEARHSFDRLAARELWFRLGLPIVPAMVRPGQGELFTYTAERNG